MKNIDFVTPIIAKKLDIDEAIIRKVNKYYWRNGVKKKLSTLSSTSLFIKGLASINISRYNLNKQLSKLIGQIRRIRKNTMYKAETKEVILNKYFTKLRTLLEKRNQLANQYYINERNKRISKADSSSFEK